MAAILLAATAAGAQASSILVIGDDTQAGGASVGSVAATGSPSIQVIGPDGTADRSAASAGAGSASPDDISPTPLVIRAGTEGAPFERAMPDTGEAVPVIDVEKPRKIETPVQAAAPSHPVEPVAVKSPARAPAPVGEEPRPQPTAVVE